MLSTFSKNSRGTREDYHLRPEHLVPSITPTTRPVYVCGATDGKSNGKEKKLYSTTLLLPKLRWTVGLPRHVMYDSILRTPKNLKTLSDLSRSRPTLHPAPGTTFKCFRGWRGIAVPTLGAFGPVYFYDYRCPALLPFFSRCRCPIIWAVSQFSSGQTQGGKRKGLFSQI